MLKSIRRIARAITLTSLAGLLGFILLMLSQELSKVRAAEVYRCAGNVYQGAPCAGGSKLTIDPNTNVMAHETRVPSGLYDYRPPIITSLPPAPAMPAAPAPNINVHVYPRAEHWMPVVPATRHLFPTHQHPRVAPPVEPASNYRVVAPRGL